MRTILVLGAGRSSASLVRYLLTLAQPEDWRVRIGDVSLDPIRSMVGTNGRGEAVLLDVRNDQQLFDAVAGASVVVSLLPPPFHPQVARACLNSARHLITASYVSEEMKSFHAGASDKGLLFLNECGLDPGIDHMSAMKIIDELQSKNIELQSFESFTGGLIVPETDPGNPWRYKFTWNPRNVVTAGQGVARYVSEGINKYIPYHQLFRRTTPIHVPGVGDFEGYANRDSLQYRSAYGLHTIGTLIRGTLRHQGFCSAWDVFVQLGCCDDSYAMEQVERMTHQSFISAFLPKRNTSAKERLISYLGLNPDSHPLKCLDWSGLFEDEPVGLTEGTPARILEHILNKRWRLNPEDNDMIVMWHRFGYPEGKETRHIQSYLVVKGSLSAGTAMAQTVGLPLGIAARLLLNDKIKTRGVAIPVAREFYEPMLRELEGHGIRMEEKTA